MVDIYLFYIKLEQFWLFVVRIFDDYFIFPLHFDGFTKINEFGTYRFRTHHIYHFTHFELCFSKLCPLT